jgi:hypothetical protein
MPNITHVAFRHGRAFILTSATALFAAGAALAVDSAAVDQTSTRPIRGIFAFPDDGPWHSVTLGTEFTEIQRLSLPAGRYIANATAQLVTGATGPITVDCRFRIIGVAAGGAAHGTISGLGAPQHFATIAHTAGFSILERKDLRLECRAEFASVVFSQPSPITAIRVNELVVRKGIGF